MKFNKLSYQDTSNFNNLLIVDGLNLAFRYKYANQKDYASKYFATVQSLAKSYEAKKIIVLGDGGSEYRKKIDPEYKANREEMRAKQTEEEKEEFQQFLDEFNRTLEFFDSNYLTLRYKGVEADDIAAYAVKHFANIFDHTWLISSDKDWDLLINNNVSRFSYVTRKEITFKNWNDSYPFEPDQYIDIKVLQGDKGDNVRGCEGIAEKRAYTLIHKYGSALDIHDSIPLPGTQKFIKNLNEFKDRILINYELMDLVTYCDAALIEHKREIFRKMEKYLYYDDLT